MDKTKEKIAVSKIENNFMPTDLGVNMNMSINNEHESEEDSEAESSHSTSQNNQQNELSCNNYMEEDYERKRSNKVQFYVYSNRLMIKITTQEKLDRCFR